MLQPARSKWRKQSKGRNRGKATRGNLLAFGDFGLQASDRGRLTARQIEAGRIAISRHVKRCGKLWIRVFPDKPVSKKPLEVRMGKGKGAPEYWVAVIKPGRVVYELEGVTHKLAQDALNRAASKLPIKTRFVSREMLI
ncbi:MAG: 50S ribosomal protein L16 [Deltaproteobacteria bacterium CG11_big_fil_rev_8_21_14_0_20_45_16]|nr:MAG: 50S ribosomal protein L16 [Deltaproteobacteria bacterium CG11_big_fil_rev_8_21_14_0_20_45_16]